MKIASCILLIFLFVAACSSRFNQQTEEPISEAKLDSLRTVYYKLNDTIQFTWQSMMEDDNGKITNMLMLLDEVKKTGHYPDDSLAPVADMIGALKSMQYDSVSVGDPNLIKRYDSLTLNARNAIATYAEGLPAEESSPMISVLLDRVLTAQSSAVLYRVSYDNFIYDFNLFLEKYKGMMSSIDSSRERVYKRPTFRLVNDYKEDN